MEDVSVSVLTAGLSPDENRALTDVDGVSSVAPLDVDALCGQPVHAREPTCVVVGVDGTSIDEPSAARAIETIERVRRADAEATIVVYATAASDALAADAIAAGATSYVPRRRGLTALRTATENALEEATRRRQAALDSAILTELLHRSPIEIYAKDTEARHVRSTKTVRHDDAAGKTEPELADEDRAATIHRVDRNVLEREDPITGKLNRYEVSQHSIDDHDSGWLRSWAYPWYAGNGRLRGLIGFAQDVTGVEETNRELTQKNRLLSQFASVVSHDLRNPLTLAQGYLDLARENGEEDAFDEIERSHRRMAEIIDDLVRLTRDSSAEPSLSSVEIAGVARDAWKTVGTGSATLRLETDSELVVADRGLLLQIFENLFRNAVEHSSTSRSVTDAPEDAVEHGSRSPASQAQQDTAEHGTANTSRSVTSVLEEGDDETVTITVGLEDERNGLYVADDGPGLPAAVRDRVNAGEFSDGGLGVNIVRTIADRHGWGIEAGESETGGAKFTFTECRLVTNPETEFDERDSHALTDAATVGDVEPGTHRRDGDSWTVTGTGRNLWRNVNEFYYVYGAAGGDVDLVARLTDFTAGHKSAKAGVMVKSGLDPGSPHGFVGCTAERGSEALWQLEPDAGTQSQLIGDEATPPRWYRLKREDDLVTAFTSENGDDWLPVTEQRLPLAERALYGLVVVAHTRDEPAVATFEDVSLRSVTWEPDSSRS